jgi:hypothetical protein
MQHHMVYEYILLSVTHKPQQSVKLLVHTDLTFCVTTVNKSGKVSPLKEH